MRARSPIRLNSVLKPFGVIGPPRSVVVLDPEQVRAAVTVALDAALPSLVDEISAKVLAALQGTGRKAGA